MDTSSTVGRLPRPGETVLASQLLSHVGGKGANQAVAAARSGASVTMVARVGTDAAGDEATSTLRAEGVCVDGVLRSGSLPTGRAFISVDPEGQNQIVVASGANAALSPADLDAVAPLAAPGGIVLAQGEIDPSTIVHASELAARRRSRFVLNLAPVVELPPETLRASDPLVVNEVEAEALGIDTSDLETDLARHVGTLATSLVVTLGGAGAISARTGVVVRHPAPEVTAVDTTGAGDAFVGALVAALADGASLEEATDEAVEAGAFSVRHHGTITSYRRGGRRGRNGGAA
ncbi:ribokinase [Pseudonocardia ailaonensis]|uniref:Deoxyribokinase n=2 Tax=Pseudonocardia ailaonensis TaxID=367279 RepID=A0ABN2MHA3_9PSEU